MEKPATTAAGSYADLTEKARTGSYIIVQEKFVYVSPRMAEIFGYSQEEMLKLPRALDVVMPEDRERVQAHMEKRLNQEMESVVARFCGCKKSGEPVLIEIHGGLYAFQEQLALTGTISDLSCYKEQEADLQLPRQQFAAWNQQMEEKILERTTEMEAANQQLKTMVETLQQTQNRLVQSEKMAALGRLVAGVAHEINTPVGIGVTAASHLNQKARDFAALYTQGKMKKSDLEKFLAMAVEASDIILSNLRHAAELITGFKEVAVDQSSEARRRFPVRRYIDEVLLSLRPALKRTRHQVTVECPEELVIDSYPGALSQIITNLVINSLVHAYDEEDAGHIHFQVERQGDDIHFTYANDGKAMDQETLDRIFEPFFTTRRGRGGTGLGMPMIYNLVTTKLAGTIYCESEEGRGTVFHIRFPLGGEKKGE